MGSTPEHPIPVVAAADDVSAKPATLFAPKTVDEVYGMLARPGPALSIEAMDAAVMAEARRRAALI